MIHLYHTPGTRSSRPLWALEETGLPYEVTLLSREERQSDEHRARHPLGRVPLLHDGTGYVYESVALVLYIADLAPDAGLNWPLGTHERALVYQWASFGMLELERYIIEIMNTKEAGADGLEATARERWAASLAVIDDALDGKEWLVGGRLSAADIVCSSVLAFAQRHGLTDGAVNVEGYLTRVEGLPARRRALAVGT